jgi:tetratricopeptide (TPR) repeat protein
MGDRYLYAKSLSVIGHIHFFRGAQKELLKTVNEGLAYGKQHSDLRSLGMGYTGLGLSHLIAGHFKPAIENCKKAVQVSEDPVYSMAFRTMLSFSYLSASRYQEAEKTAKKLLSSLENMVWIGWEQ